MKLYNLVNTAALKEGEILQDIGFVPSYIKIGQIPFLRVYLVSKNIKKINEAAKTLNRQAIGEVNFMVQELSLLGKLKFYFGCYFLGRLLPVGESMDLDSDINKFDSYLSWSLTATSKIHQNPKT